MREHRLRHRHLADYVDFELTAQLVGRHRLHRAADEYAGVAHQRVEARGQLRRQRGDLLGV